MEYVNEHPSRLEIEEFAKVIKASNYKLNDAMKVLFKSKAFFAPYNKNTIIRSPVDRMADAVRRIGKPYDFNLLVKDTMSNGQELGAPPSILAGMISGQIRKAL